MAKINQPPFPDPGEKIIQIVKFIQYKDPSGYTFWRVEFQIPEGDGYHLRAFERLSECVEEFLQGFKE